MTNSKNLRAYLTGFILCVTITLVAFSLYRLHYLSETHLYLTLASLAILQLIIQSICFLTLNTSQEGRWNLFPYLFTLLIIFILAGGTLWIMHNLNVNMMS